jgi:hypothetical protein
MKPIKLNKIPPDPCVDCLVVSACTKTCRPKVDYADYIKSVFYGNHLNNNRDCRRKNADILIELYRLNRKHTHLALHFEGIKVARGNNQNV